MTAPLLAAQVQGQGSVSADNLNTYEQTCDNFAQLRGFVGLPGIQVFVRGRSTPSDGGDGVFYWSATSTGPDNNSTVIVPTAAALGAWIKLLPSPGYPITPEMFGAVGNGVTDDYPALAAAIAFLEARQQGGTLFFGAKRYAISAALQLTTANIALVGQGVGSTELNPLTANMTCICIEASFCYVSGFSIQNRANASNVRGIQLGPLAGGSTVLTTNSNVVLDIFYSGLAYGRLMAPGAPDSECYFNNFYSETFLNVGLAIFFETPTITGNGGANSNNTYGAFIYSGGTTSNSGIVIFAGAYNNFYGSYIEGMSNAGPLPTPTAIQVLASGGGLNNVGNAFFGCNGEGNTRDLDLQATGTEFYNCSFPTNNNYAVRPAVMIAGDPNTNPTVLPGYAFENNSELAGLYNNLTTVATGALGFVTQPNGTGVPVSGEFLGGRQDFPITANTGPGGGTITLDVPWAYVANAVYEIWAGGFDVAGTQVSYNTRATYVEGPSGTFTALDPNSGSSYGSYAIAAGSPSTSTVTIGRSTGNITVAVDIAKTAITFTCYAKIHRHV